jgi:hypothetical protein
MMSSAAAADKRGLGLGQGEAFVRRRKGGPFIEREADFVCRTR